MGKKVFNLKRVFMKVFTMALLFIFVVVVMLAGDYFNPRKIEAEPITMTAILGIGVVLSVCGLIFLNRQSIVNAAQSFWDTLTAPRQNHYKEKLDNVVYEEGSQWDMTEDEFNEIKQFVQDNYSDKIGSTGVEYQIQSQQVTPWGTNVSSISVDNAFGYNYGQTYIITEELFSAAPKYESITWSDSAVIMNYEWNQIQQVYKLYFNGTLATEYPSDANKYTTVFFQNVYDQYAYYCAKSVTTAYVYNEESAPFFTFFKNNITGIMYPVVCYRYENDVYRAKSFIYNYEGDVVFENEGDILNIDVIVDPSVVLDEYYDILYEGMRSVQLPADIGYVIGLTAGDVMAQEWQDMMAAYPYLASGEFTLSGVNVQNGALSVSVTNEMDLDIPENYIDWSPLTMNIELVADKFPFSIPFDLYYAVAGLVEEPEAPVIDVPFPNSIYKGGSDLEMSFDFSIFDGVIIVIRWTILIGFVISLIILTRKLIRG